NVGTLQASTTHGSLVGFGVVTENGLIGTLDNSVTVAGILNTGSGSITSLVNNASGSIAGDRAGLFNAGNITLIDNFGMISSNSPNFGTVAGIWNNGGTISNLNNVGTLQASTTHGSLVGFGVVTENGLIGTLDNS
ncbi:hypothetical protein CTI14_42965, partial [Methylobacterium radiotolerans]